MLNALSEQSLQRNSAGDDPYFSIGCQTQDCWVPQMRRISKIEGLLSRAHNISELSASHARHTLHTFKAVPHTGPHLKPAAQKDPNARISLED